MNSIQFDAKKNNELLFPLWHLKFKQKENFVYSSQSYTLCIAFTLTSDTTKNTIHVVMYVSFNILN